MKPKLEDILARLGKIARYQSNTAAHRGDAIGGDWKDLADLCDAATDDKTTNPDKK